MTRINVLNISRFTDGQSLSGVDDISNLYSTYFQESCRENLLIECVVET